VSSIAFRPIPTFCFQLLPSILVYPNPQHFYVGRYNSSCSDKQADY
jgi:hypothetical protein